MGRELWPSVLRPLVVKQIGGGRRTRCTRGRASSLSSKPGRVPIRECNNGLCASRLLAATYLSHNKQQTNGLSHLEWYEATDKQLKYRVSHVVIDIHWFQGLSINVSGPDWVDQHLCQPVDMNYIQGSVIYSVSDIHSARAINIVWLNNPVFHQISWQPLGIQKWMISYLKAPISIWQLWAR